MQIEPQFTLPLIYELTDPFDTSTYYIQAVIRDSLTGSILDTINLTSQGSGRYSSTVYPPQDATGFGKHIDVTISVYTDSDYTTYSDVYQKKIDKYIVKTSKQSFGGGSGADIDYDKIRKIVKEIIDNQEDEEEDEPIDLTPVYDRFEAIRASIDAIDIPKTKEIDFSPILSALGGVSKRLSTKIDEKEVTKVTPTDLTPLTNLASEIKSLLGNLDSKIEETRKNNSKELDLVSRGIKDSILDAEKRVQEIKNAASGVLAEIIDKRESGGDNKILKKYL